MVCKFPNLVLPQCSQDSCTSSNADTELPQWTALSTVNVVGSLLAAGVLQMRGINGWSGWQWLFLLEGILTLIVGIFSFGLMPPGPCQTRNWFRGAKGWFDEREEKIMVNRLLRDDPSKGDMNNRQAVGPKLLWKAIQDWEQWPLYLVGLTTYIPPSPPQNYLSLILRELGFSTFESNLLVIPSQVMFALNLLFVTCQYHSFPATVPRSLFLGMFHNFITLGPVAGD